MKNLPNPNGNVKAAYENEMRNDKKIDGGNGKGAASVPFRGGLST